MSTLTYKPVPYRLGTITPSSLKHWGPPLAIWCIGAGIYTTYLLSVTPLVKRRFLIKIPVLGKYYEDKTPDEDKPF